MTDAPLLVIDALDAHYGTARALEEVSFEVGVESVSIVGRNGMGKTTLCNAIMGVPPAHVQRLDPLPRRRGLAASRRTDARSSGSATSRRAGACSPRSPSTSTCA